MAEKRRLSARERREPAAKRRVSEATTRASSPAQPQPSSRRKASTPAVVPSPSSTPNPPEVIQPPLPTKIKDVDPLPTLPSAQPANLSPKEYQSIAESAVLLASLERSKKKWLSDGILERYWTKPKKTKRDQIEGKNPPKESMSKVGPCNIVVGPHLFDAMLYTVKDPNAPPPVQYAPAQRPMVHYGHPNNFQQYQPYPQAPHNTPTQRTHPPQPSHGTPPAQQAYQQGRPPPPQPARTPNQTPHRPSGPPSAQRPANNQNPPPQPPKANPDPVIQMLATRAAQDPELKALMRLVASTNATQEQLRTFQAHIDELNAIIRAREQQQRRQQQQQQPSQPPTPSPAQPSPRPQSLPQPPPTPQQPSSQAPPQPLPATPQQQSSQPGQQPSTQTQPARPRVEVQVPKQKQAGATPQNPSTNSPNLQPSQAVPTTPQVKQEPGVTTTAQAQAPQVASPSVGPGPHQSPATAQTMPPPPQQQPSGQKPGQQYPQQYQQPPYQGQPIQSRPPQYSSPAPYYRATPPRPPAPPRLNYKSVVFEFTSPLTPYGSSTSGHAGSGDRYLFPENTILEWLPGGTTVLASFLLVKKVDPTVPFPIEAPPEAVPSRAKGKSAPKSKKADKNKDKPGDEKDKSKDGETNPQGSNPVKADPSHLDSKPSPQDGQVEQKTTQAMDSNLKEYYQPVTFRIYSTNPKVLEPLARVVKPQEEVRKYMNEIMDRAERAPDGFLAYQLPRDHPVEDHDSETDKKAGTPVPSNLVNGRSKLSRGMIMGEESDFENAEGLVEDEEEELKDFYGAPTGLVPLGI
ncbi:hypothetical protein BJY04DRAFT_221146 [Aspergillus karnatakaensis]|uniref:uncharacterized protein n=1 Tax=Aspergillus karnatakaensis TaxID=1810916 RepID=UPI003CCE30D6